MAPPFEAYRRGRLAALDLAFVEHLAQGFPTPEFSTEADNETLQCRDATDQIRWLGLLMKSQAAIDKGAGDQSIDPPIRCTSNNEYAVSHAEAASRMMALLEDYGQALKRYWSVKDAITAAPTRQALNDIDIQGGLALPELAVVFGAYERTGDPTLIAQNCFAESVETPAGRKMQLRARPGLEELSSVGGGPLRGIVQKDGLFDGSAIVLSRTTLYTVNASGVSTAFTGTIPGEALVDIALGQDADLNSVAYIATGSGLYKATGGAVTAIDFPTVGGPGAKSVDYISGYFIAVEAGTDMFYYLPPGASAWAPLDFASAEYAPDPLVFVRARGEQIAFGGSATFQVFGLSGDVANPITPYGGINEDFGARSRAAAVNCAGTLIWVDNQSNVRRWDGGATQIISNPGLAELIASVDDDDLVAWEFAIPGHHFYVLRIGDAATWVYDLMEAGERWTTFSSLGIDYWRAQIGCNIGDVVLACDSTSSQIYRLNAAARTDGEDVFAMEWTALVMGTDTPQPMANAVLICDLGDAPRTGQGSEPLVQLKWSDDQGKSFSGWRERPLGATGVNKPPPRWSALGTVPAHFGRILRFRISDPVGRVIRAVKANVP